VRIIASGFAARFVPMSDKILYITGNWLTEPSLSGKLEVCSVNLDGSDKTIVFVDPGCTHDGGNVTYSMSVSPDGKSIAWIKTSADFSQDIITYNLETKVESQVTFSRNLKDEVFWTEDNHLIYSSYANGNFDLWMSSADGGEPLQLTRSRNDEMYGALCDDGSKLLYYEINLSGNIKSMDLTTGKVTSVTSDDQNRTMLCISPDNRYVAYTAVPSYNNWLTRRGIQIIDTKGEDPLRTVCAKELNSGQKAWSPNGRWMAFAIPPDSVGGNIRVCVVSPFDGTRPRVVAEAKGTPDQNIYLRWIKGDSLSWFSEMKTWVCALEKSHPIQVYKDSTRAREFQGGKFVFYRDYRSGRQGWWIDDSPMSANGIRRTPRKIVDLDILALASSGEFLLYETKNGGDLVRVSLPDGKATRLAYRLPLMASSFGITQDGKALIYLEYASNSKLMLWENPFIKD
jgi:Tol biopolymer transport system component